MTVALCGDDGACRWPHHNAITPRGSGYLLRTVFVAPEDEEIIVREMIANGLRDANEWEVVSTASRTLTARRAGACRAARAGQAGDEPASLRSHTSRMTSTRSRFALYTRI